MLIERRLWERSVLTVANFYHKGRCPIHLRFVCSRYNHDCICYTISTGRMLIACFNNYCCMSCCRRDTSDTMSPLFRKIERVSKKWWRYLSKTNDSFQKKEMKNSLMKIYMNHNIICKTRRGGGGGGKGGVEGAGRRRKGGGVTGWEHLQCETRRNKLTIHYYCRQVYHHDFSLTLSLDEPNCFDIYIAYLSHTLRLGCAF